MKNSRIKQSIILASVLVFIGYGWLLIDWLQDMKLGRYEREPINTLVEMGVIVAYCYLAYRFIQARMTSTQHTNDTQNQDRKSRSLRHSYSLLRKMTASATLSKPGAESTSWLSTRSQRLK
ncbi:hypothetical protein GCM10028807_41290 [Spirosoma daeguense]